MANEQSIDREKLIKRLRFRARHRGTKEADIVVAAYAERVLENAPQKILLRLEEFLRLDDQVLVDILSGDSAWPEAFGALCGYGGCDKRLS